MIAFPYRFWVDPLAEEIGVRFSAAILTGALDELCDAVLRFNGGVRQPVERIAPPAS